jgi:hypothetical protein
LIPADRQVHPYSAAFSPGHVDCVTPRRMPGGVIPGFRQWWAGMAKRRSASVGARTITELVRSDQKATFLIVASELYLKAVWPDLNEAASAHRAAHRANILIVSAGTKNFDDLAALFVPLDARMQSVLGGARRSLNTRMARQLIMWMKPNGNFAQLRERCHKLLQGAEPISASIREKSTDVDVSRFIRNELIRDDRKSASALLRRFRDDCGRACEQKRFSRLYHQTKEAIRA